jgi:ABC-type uncharacterized transport system permease subunit
MYFRTALFKNHFIRAIYRCVCLSFWLYGHSKLENCRLTLQSKSSLSLSPSHFLPGELVSILVFLIFSLLHTSRLPHKFRKYSSLCTPAGERR